MEPTENKEDTLTKQQPKRQKTEAQLAAFKKAQETRNKNIEIKRQAKAEAKEKIKEEKNMRQEEKWESALRVLESSDYFKSRYQPIVKQAESEEEQEEQVIIKKKKSTKPKKVVVIEESESDEQEEEEQQQQPVTRNMKSMLNKKYAVQQAPAKKTNFFAD